MKRHAAATAMGLACLSGAALAQADSATWVRPKHLRWFGPPNLAVVQARGWWALSRGLALTSGA